MVARSSIGAAARASGWPGSVVGGGAADRCSRAVVTSARRSAASGGRRAASPAGPADVRPVDRLGDRRAGGRRLRVGPDLLVRRAVPQAGRRAAGADPVQHADGGPLHRRAVPHRRRALLLHGDRADRRRQAQPRIPTSPSRSSRSSGTGSSTTATASGTEDAQDGRVDGRLQRRHPGAGAADRQDDPVRGDQPDVIHSFWVPELLFKRDVFPGNVRNVFEVTIDKTGAYVGRCAELCGTYHSIMNFELRAVSPENYEQFIAAKEAGKSHTGGARPSARSRSRPPPRRSTPSGSAELGTDGAASAREAEEPT